MSFERYTYRGIVAEIGERNTSPSGWTWREITITDGGAMFPQFVPFVFSRVRVDMPTCVERGQLVDVVFGLRGRVAPNGRCFPQLYGLGIQPAQLAPEVPGAAATVGAPGASAPATLGAPPLEAPPGSPGTPAEDLPF